MPDNLDQLLAMVSENTYFKGGFFEELLQILKERNFRDSNKPIISSEKSVGDMNDLEKALNTLIVQYEEIEEECWDKINRMQTSGEEILPDEVELIDLMINQARNRNDAARALLNEILIVRFNHLLTEEFPFIEVRNGFKLVPSKEEAGNQEVESKARAAGFYSMEFNGMAN
jgi:hypothetical protein